MNVHCARSQRGVVEAIERDQVRALPFSFDSLEARRDGARVSATLAFKDSGSGRLMVKLELDLGPPIRLASGTFLIRQSGQTFAGKVEATALNFQAGQSGRMSLGGQFLLFDQSSTASYRVILRPTLTGSAYH